MKRLYLSIICLVSVAGAFADTSLTGFVKERNGNGAIPYATVSLLATDSTLVTGAISDEKGAYTLSADEGTYILKVSYVGYNTMCRTLDVAGKKQVVDDVFLTEETEELGEVQVQAKRPLVERQVDKLVLNVSQSAFAIGNSGQDILKKAPGVNIDKDGNVTVNGKSVEIYIDGRPSYMSGEQLKGLLQGTDGATIDKIEIITNPSSKYDAAGQGGIINIKLKKNKSQGFNGMLNAAYGGMYYKNPGKYYQMDFGSLNLNYRSAKTYTSLGLTQVYAGQGQQLYMESVVPVVTGNDTLKQRSVSETTGDINFQYYNMRLSNDWYIDDANTLGFILNVPFMKIDISSEPQKSHTLLTLGNDTLEYLNNTLRQPIYAPQHTANINFTHVFNDSLSRELTMNVDYNRYANRSTNNQTNEVIVNKLDPVPNLMVDTRQKVDIYSAKLDFQTAFWKTGMIECGAKWAMSNTFNTMTTDSMLPDWRNQTVTRYDYSEQVAAAYVSAAKQFNEHWNAKLGLRGELTYAHGNFEQGAEKEKVNIKPYFNLFPTAFIGYNPNDKWSLSASYTRRIKRPSYWTLNPFVRYIDAHSYEVGNPELKPEFNNQVDLNVGWSRYISVAFNFGHTTQMHTEKIEVLPDGDRKLTWENFGTCTTHGGAVSLTEIPIVPKRNADGKIDGAWLALTANANALHFINRASADNYVKRSFWASFYGCLTAYLPEDIQISVDASYETPMIVGYSKIGNSYDLNFGFKKQFLQKTLTVSLNVNDILRSSNYTEQGLGLPEGYSSLLDVTMLGSQRVSIGISYMFGQFQYHKYRKVGEQDESSRLGGNSGYGGK